MLLYLLKVSQREEKRKGWDQRVGHIWSWSSDNKLKSSCYSTWPAIILRTRTIYVNPEQNYARTIDVKLVAVAALSR